jgi:hypothetical protein
MPSFTFEKISPPVRRAPAAAAPKKPRGVISLVIDRFAERRAKRAQRVQARSDGKPAK